jgi:hypothetical protein
MAELSEIHERIISMSDEELYQMVSLDWEQYRPEAVDYARDEIRKRGSSFQLPPAPNETEKDDRYFTEWQTYRGRRKIFWLVFLVPIPALACIGAPLAQITGSALPIYSIFMLSSVAIAIVSFYTMNWKCPRCRKPYFHKWFYGNSFATRCVHCKLPKWSGAGTSE